MQRSPLPDRVDQRDHSSRVAGSPSEVLASNCARQSCRQTFVAETRSKGRARGCRPAAHATPQHQNHPNRGPGDLTGRVPDLDAVTSGPALPIGHAFSKVTIGSQLRRSRCAPVHGKLRELQDLLMSPDRAMLMLTMTCWSWHRMRALLLAIDPEGATARL